MFISPSISIESVPGVGGGRGIFAKQFIRAGTLLIEEQPFEYPEFEEERPLHLNIAHFILQNPSQIPFFADLHPVSLQDISKENLERSKIQHKDSIDQFSSEFVNISHNEILRTILAVQFNAFSTGLYHIQSMINHHCSPNCTKSTKRESSRSQIIACGDIQQGEEITIHYGPPIERSWRYRQRFIDQQHYFQIEKTPFTLELDGPLNDSQIQWVDEIENRMDLPIDDVSTAFECLEKASTYLPPSHFVVIRAHRFALRELLKMLEKNGDPAVALRALHSIVYLRDEQKKYLSPDHLDVAAIAEDIEQVLSFLLSNSPQELFANFPKEFGSFSKASTAEFKAKKEKIRIRKLYT